jgi:hypothetical protein
MDIRQCSAGGGTFLDGVEMVSATSLRRGESGACTLLPAMRNFAGVAGGAKQAKGRGVGRPRRDDDQDLYRRLSGRLGLVRGGRRFCLCEMATEAGRRIET